MGGTVFGSVSEVAVSSQWHHCFGSVTAEYHGVRASWSRTAHFVVAEKQRLIKGGQGQMGPSPESFHPCPMLSTCDYFCGLIDQLSRALMIKSVLRDWIHQPGPGFFVFFF